MTDWPRRSSCSASSPPNTEGRGGSANGWALICSTAPAQRLRSGRQPASPLRRCLPGRAAAAWCPRELEGFVTIGMVLVIYGAFEAIGAYGLLAVFAAGFTFRRYEFDHEMHRAVHHGADAAGKTLELLVLLMLGTMLTTAGLSAPGAAGWLLAPLLLLVIRPTLVFATVRPKAMDRRGSLIPRILRRARRRRALLRRRSSRSTCTQLQRATHPRMDNHRLRRDLHSCSRPQRQTTHEALARDHLTARPPHRQRRALLCAGRDFVLFERAHRPLVAVLG